ncbi:hypothetical protein B0H14DRAFT_3133442 [Mycena olivaceomarginata]|nr:hypothetical protein B0H14DRAFT_3133442 [Mycena olivaceomarginata]
MFSRFPACLPSLPTQSLALPCFFWFPLVSLMPQSLVWATRNTKESSTRTSTSRNSWAYVMLPLPLANALKAAEARRTTVEEVPDEGDSISSHADEATGISCNDRGCSDSSHLHSHSDAAEANDWDFDLGNELPDADCDVIEDSVDLDLDREIVLAPEISDEAELDTFSQVLFEAQPAAQKAEHKREQSRKRPKTYSGNAARTLRAHKKRGRDLASKGFLGVFDFIKAKKQSSTSSQLGTPEHTCR